MRLLVVSGRSGSGKSTALHVLEDEGFYCIDNMPAALLMPLIEQMRQDNSDVLQRVAVSIDARNSSRDLTLLPQILHDIRASNIECEVIYLDARKSTLIKRFSETRRKHPLSDYATNLSTAIAAEKKLLEPIANLASLTIDTSNLTLYQLRDTVLNRVARPTHVGLSLLFLSFGYKHGIPVDADIVFDVRCLTNPYWKPELRGLTGLAPLVQDFLAADPRVRSMLDDIRVYLEKWLPAFHQQRRYMTVAIGCMGGQHRSVYISAMLQCYFNAEYKNTQLRHRELSLP